MSLMRVLILLAHGSRREKANREVAEWAQILEREGTAPVVVPAFLEMADPCLDDVVSNVMTAGATRIDVLPLFLNRGKHVEIDVPKLVDNPRQQHPETVINLLQHIGSGTSFLALLKECAAIS